jgi:hypothetical protein
LVYKSQPSLPFGSGCGVGASLNGDTGCVTISELSSSIVPAVCLFIARVCIKSAAYAPTLVCAQVAAKLRLGDEIVSINSEPADAYVGF